MISFKTSVCDVKVWDRSYDLSDS